ncbi:MAG: hypothetical protein ACE5EL_04215, partial [Anaerolineae bacterium]
VLAASLLVLLGSLALAMAAAARWHRGSGVASVDRGPRPLATTGHGLLGTAGLALVAVVAAAPVVADAANKEARLAWLPLVAEARSAAEAGEALSFLDRAGIRLRLARRLAPWDAAYALGLARLQTERAGLMDDLMTRRLAAAGSAAVPSPDQGEYDPFLLAGEALELAQGRDEAMGEALAEAAAAEELSAPGPEAPLTRARALRVWGGLTREEERRRHRLAAADGAYAEAIDRAPNWPEVYDEAAWVAILAGDPAGALGRTEEALAADPFFLRAHRTAARAHAALGDAVAAAAQYDLYFADERNAADVDAQRGRLEVLAAAGRRADALVVAEGIVRLAPDDPRGYADLAVLRQARGDLAGARAAAAVAASLAPSDPGIAALVKDLAKELAPGP